MQRLVLFVCIHWFQLFNFWFFSLSKVSFSVNDVCIHWLPRLFYGQKETNRYLQSFSSFYRIPKYCLILHYISSGQELVIRFHLKIDTVFPEIGKIGWGWMGALNQSWRNLKQSVLNHQKQRLNFIGTTWHMTCLTYEFPPTTFKNKKFDHLLNISTSLPGLLVYS